MKNNDLKSKWNFIARIEIATFISIPLIPILAFCASKLDRESLLYNMFGAFTIICIVVFCIGVLCTTFWPCPKCGKPFNTGRGGNIPSSKCKHCGLPFGADEI